MFQRILVVGCPGSGKSTFARRLQECTGLPLYHLDLLYWRADKTTLPREEFDEALDALLAEERWIIDGNFSRTMERRLQRCDAVFFLDLPTEVCLEGVRQRRGKPRPDLPWIETEEDAEFMDFIRSFPEKRAPEIRALLQSHPEVAQTVFHSREEMEEYLRTLQK